MASESREIMEALGDKTRFSIVEAVSRKPMTGDEIADSVQKARSTVESHLSVLLRLNLVSRRLEDRTYYYEATDISKNYIAKKVDTADSAETIAAVKSLAQSSIAPSLKGSLLAPSSLISISIASVIGIAWAVLNVLVLPVHIFIPALTIGVIAGIMRRSVKSTLNMAIIASFFIAIISYLLTIGTQPLNLVLLFFAALTFMVLLGLAGLFLTRLFMKRAKKSWKFK